jgi:hypothetical protein
MDVNKKLNFLNLKKNKKIIINQQNYRINQSSIKDKKEHLK